MKTGVDPSEIAVDSRAAELTQKLDVSLFQYFVPLA